MRCKYFFLLLLTIVLGACGPGSTNNSTANSDNDDVLNEDSEFHETNFRIILDLSDGTPAGDTSGPPVEASFREQREFIDFFHEHFGSLPNVRRPSVDFAKEMVVAVLIGERPSTGYEVHIHRIIEKAKSIVVFYEEVLPGKNCQSATVLTSPSQIIAMPRSPKDVHFEKNVRRSRPCQ